MPAASPVWHTQASGAACLSRWDSQLGSLSPPAFSVTTLLRVSQWDFRTPLSECLDLDLAPASPSSWVNAFRPLSTMVRCANEVGFQVTCSLKSLMVSEIKVGRHCFTNWPKSYKNKMY